jgi:hypothetical protein
MGTEDLKAPKASVGHALSDMEQRDTELAKKSILSKFKVSTPGIKTATNAPPGIFPTIPRATLIVLLICVVGPGIQYSGGEAEAGALRTPELVENGNVLIHGREDSPTIVCTRWAHQSRSRKPDVKSSLGD